MVQSIVVYPDPNLLYYLHTDAGEESFWTILAQSYVIDGNPHHLPMQSFHKKCNVRACK